MRSVVKFFIEHPIWANAIIAIVVIFGVASYFAMPKSFFPKVPDDTIEIMVSYPGASPVEMEEGVTLKIEEGLTGLVGVKEVTSTSAENVANIRVEMVEGYDIDELLTDVKNAVDQISSLPQSAERPVVRKDRFRDRVAFINLRGSSTDLFALKKEAQTIEDDMLSSGFISEVNIYGFPPVEFSIEVRENDLLRYGLTFDDVARAIRQNNTDVSGGLVKTYSEQIRLRSNAREVTEKEIAEIPLRSTDDGSQLRLRDVADVRYQFSDAPNESRVNGERAINMFVTKLPEEDLQEIADWLDNYVEEYNASHSNTTLFIPFNFETLLSDRIELLTNNGIIGLSLVLLSLGLFLSLRLSFWVAFGIPASFLGMFIIAFLAGVTINMISLFAMILVIGILVDDGIVIGENIFTHFKMGKTPYQAALDGTMEVLPAVFTSILTTILAFVPLVFLDNNGFSIEIALVVAACLGVSLVEAFFVLPAHLASEKVLNRNPRKGMYSKFREKIEQAFNFLRDRLYGSLLRRLLRWDWAVVFIPVVLTITVFGMVAGGFIKQTLFPSVPFDQLDVAIELKPGTAEHITSSYLDRIEKEIIALDEDMKEHYGIDEFMTSRSRGLGYDGEGKNGPHVGNFGMLFVPLDPLGISTFDIADSLRRRVGPIPEAENFSVGGNNRWGSPVDVALQGRDLEQLQLAKEELKAELADLPQLKDIQDNSLLGFRELDLTLKPMAYFLGLDRQEITKQVRQGFFGEEAQRLQVGQDEVRVWVRYPEEDRVSLAQLEKMRVKVPGVESAEYPLSALVDYQVDRDQNSIAHINGKREVRVQAETVDPNEPVSDIIAKLDQEILPAILAKYPEVTYEHQGQEAAKDDIMASAQLPIMLCLVGIIFLLTMIFRSPVQAFMILGLLPIGIACAMFGHFIEARPFSILSFYGLLALSGVIINDAVVMMDKYNQLVRDGMSVQDAAFEAGKARFRAILLTSITTVAGLMPLIQEKSFQAQFLIPMAVSMAYGVLFGTLIILLFFPVYIKCVNDMRVYLTWAWRIVRHDWLRWGGDAKPLREELEPAVVLRGKDEKRRIG